jgi:acyl-CoA thioesterase
MSSTPPSALHARIGGDPYARWLGIELVDLEPGYCRAAMTLGTHMVNFQGNPHGGAIFSLADFAFGAACNAHGQAAVALTVSIQFVDTVTPGTRLVAEARAERQGRRAGFYSIRVTAADGTPVALCQAVAHRPRG